MEDYYEVPIVEKLRSVPNAPSWQPMETAPKDGTRMLLAIDHGEWGAFVACGCPDCVREMRDVIRGTLALLADIKAWDIEQAGETFKHTGKACRLLLPHEIRARIQRFLANV